MSIEQQPSAGPKLEQQFARLSAIAVKKAKLFSIRLALTVLENVSEEATALATIPKQFEPTHDSLDGTSQAGRQTINDCASLFDRAIEFQLTSPMNLIGLNKGELTNSQYLALKADDGNTLYLHRPTIEFQESSDFPFWVSHITAGINAETDEPVLYAREYYIDSLGNMQQRERVNRELTVYRSISDIEAQPIRNRIAHGEFLSMTPPTVKQ